MGGGVVAPRRAVWPACWTAGLLTGRSRAGSLRNTSVLLHIANERAWPCRSAGMQDLCPPRRGSAVALISVRLIRQYRDLFASSHLALSHLARLGQGG